MIPWYDRDGRPIDVETANELLLDWEYRRVAEDQVGPYWVSTVWLGIDHGFGFGPEPHPPIIFETMVFATHRNTERETLGPDLDCRRYTTEEEARAGHEEMVLLVRATLQEEP